MAIIHSDNDNDKSHSPCFAAVRTGSHPAGFRTSALRHQTLTSILRPRSPDPRPPSRTPPPAPAHPIREVLHDQSRHGSRAPLGSDPRTPRRRLPTTFTPPHWAPPSLASHVASARFPPGSGCGLLGSSPGKSHPQEGGGGGRTQRLHSAQAQFLLRVLETPMPGKAGRGRWCPTLAG